jgi:phosphatidylinositol glycan class V
MTYYKLKQMPNFILALPVVLIGLAASFTYLRHNPWGCITLGLIEPSIETTDKKTDVPVRIAKTDHSFSCNRNFAYLVHSMALIAFCMLFMHVQVRLSSLGE